MKELEKDWRLPIRFLALNFFFFKDRRDFLQSFSAAVIFSNFVLAQKNGFLPAFFNFDCIFSKLFFASDVRALDKPGFKSMTSQSAKHDQQTNCSPQQY